MKNSTRSAIGLFLIGGILLAILLNYKLFGFLIDQSINSALQPDEGGKMPGLRTQFGLSTVLVQILLFWLLSLSNFLLNRNGIINHWSIKATLAFWVIANLLLYTSVNMLALEFINQLLGATGKRLNLSHLMLNTNGVVAIASISAAYFALLFQKLRRQEVEKAQLLEEKTQAELSALKDQISPHFFFNTLSSLSTLVRNESKDTVLEFIQELSSTYRYTLASKQQDLVAIEDELTFVRSYLFLLKKRFGEKLSVHIDIPKELGKRQLPPISLQVLVENAVKHNIMTRDRPLEIRFFVDQHYLVVENNLQEQQQSSGMGLGLENLSNRFRLLTQQEIIIEKDANRFIVKLPFL